MTENQSASSDEARISILIPTMNRSHFLRRALTYYLGTGFSGHIIIGDSSEGDHLRENQKTVAAIAGRLNVIYRHFPSPPYVHDGMCMKEMIDMAPTMYAVYAGDDDFVIPSGLVQCAAFLDGHPEYAAAHGFRVNMKLDNPHETGNVIAASVIPGQESLSDHPVQRWIEYMRTGFSTQYFLHSTNTWRRMYREVDKVPSRYLGPELLPCSLTAILGKVKRLDCLTCVFQKNENQIFSWENQSMFNLVNQSAWPPSAAVIQDSVTGALIEKAGLSEEDASKLFEQEFWHHVINVLMQQFNTRFGGQETPVMETQEMLGQVLADSSPFFADLTQIFSVVAERSDLAANDPGVESHEGAQYDPDSEYEIGRTMLDDGDDFRAEEVFRNMIQRNPEDAKALNALACVLFKSGRPREALTTLFRAAESSPDDSDIAWNRAMVLKGLGREAEAERLIAAMGESVENQAG